MAVKGKIAFYPVFIKNHALSEDERQIRFLVSLNKKKDSTGFDFRS